MSVSYVSAGNSPTAAELNALISELDAILVGLYAGKSWLAYHAGFLTPPEGKRFYFGDDTQWKILDLLAIADAPYDHSVFTTSAAAKTVTSYDLATETAKVIEASPWDLDGSLEAHTRSHDSIDHYLWQWSDATTPASRERHRKLDVAEIIMEGMTGDLTWEVEWDKYHCLRFHNLDIVTRQVFLPGSMTIAIPPLGVKALRRKYPHEDVWDASLTYFWRAISGDSLCFDSIRANPLGSLRCFHDWMQLAEAGTPSDVGVFTKPSTVWNGSSILAQPIDGSTELIKYALHTGPIIAWEAATGATPVPSLSSPSWDELVADTGVLKLDVNTASIPHVLTLLADTGATTPVHACGPGATILPVMPKALPRTIDQGHGPIASSGALLSTGTTSATYHTGSPPTGANQVDVSQTYDVHTYTSSGWSAASLGTWSTLDDHATLTALSAAEATTMPTVTWTSDGWRLVGSGTVSFPVELGAVPTEIARCDIASTGFIEHFGRDVFDRNPLATFGDYWTLTHEDQGRRISPYVGFTDIFDQVYYTGHPDVTGDNGLAGGIDWKENRGSPSTATILRTEQLASGLTPTLTLPVYPRGDAGERIVANYGDPDWYVTNRTDLLADTTETGDRQGLLRLPILALHYNHVAQRLNSVMAIRPFTLDDVQYYGGEHLADGTWTAPAYRENFYCAVLASGSRAAELGLSISGVAGSWISLPTAAGWAATLGVRFFVRRLSAIKTALDENTGSSSSIGRQPLSSPVWIARFVQDSGSAYRAAPGVPVGVVHRNLVDIEHAQTNGIIPSGWKLAGDDKLLTIPRPLVNWDNDPLIQPGFDEFLEPVSVYGPELVDNTLWPIADVPEILDSQAIADLYELGAIDDRAAWEVWLINRFLIVRA